MMMSEKTSDWNKPIKHIGFAVALVAATLPQHAYADINDAIDNTLKFGQADAKYGQIKFDLRYRYEYADTKNNPAKPAHANTFRLRLGYLTPEIAYFQGFAEYETLFAAQNDYYVPANVYGSSQYNVIVDPADRHELNQLWLTFKGIPDTEIKGGRQRIKLDDDRFIGNVGWRQMEQTYDAVIVTNKSIKNVTIKAGYIGRVRNIKSLTDNIDAPLVHIDHNLGNYGHAIAYGYWLGFRGDQSQKATQTYGIRFTGSPKLNDTFTLHYTAEYSYQEDYSNNPLSYGLDRYNIMAGLSAFGFTLKGAMEQLDGHDGAAFQTPLGTNHAFQGWADRFLSTPTTGLRDINATLATKVAGTKLMFVYHKFQDDSSAFDYADEYDLLAVKKFGKHYSLLAKYAYYNGDKNAPGGFKNDTQKIWVQAAISF